MLQCLQNVRFTLRAKLGQRGAEMVEYAIVLACIAAVGIYFYSTSGDASGSLKTTLTNLWKKVDSVTATVPTK